VAVVVELLQVQELAQVATAAMGSTLLLVQFLLVAQVQLAQIPTARQVVAEELVETAITLQEQLVAQVDLVEAAAVVAQQAAQAAQEYFTFSTREQL
jgi:hypothetical protein